MSASECTIGADSTGFRFTPADDAEALRLLAAAQLGDHDAFNRLAGELRAFTLSMAARYFANPADREDAVQECWLAVWMWLQREDTRFPVSAIGFVAKFAQNTVRAMMASKWAAKRGGRQPNIHDAEIRACLYQQHGHRRGQSTIEQTERTPEGDPLARMGIVHRLVSKLPPEHLATLDRFFFAGKSAEEIATERAVKIADIHRLLAGGIEIIRHFAEKLAGEEMEVCA